MEKVIIIYHSKDMDGLVSGAIANSFTELENSLNEKTVEIETIGYDYGENVPEVLYEIKESSVIITDVSFDKSLYLSLLERNNSIIIFDHHIKFYNEIKEIFVGENSFIDKKEYDVFGKKIECEVFVLEKETDRFYSPSISFIYSKDNSASLISFTFILNFLRDGCSEDFSLLEQKMKDCSELIFRVDNYDLFKTFDINNTESFKKDLEFDLGLKAITGWDINKVKIFSGDNLSFIEKVKSYGKILNIFNTVNNGNSCEYMGFDRNPISGVLANKRIFCLNVAKASLITAESVFHKDYDLYLFFSYNGEKFNCSIRTTREDIDCCEIAKSFGGGGHKKASGFSVKEFESIFK